MRRYAVAAAALLLATSAITAGAGAGLPKIATVAAGPITATLHNDSPVVRRGTNTLTIEIPSMPPGYVAGLRLRGPHGQVLVVPLRPVIVLGEGGDGHGAGGDGRDDGSGGHGAADSRDSHGSASSPNATTHGHDTRGAADDHSTVARAPRALLPAIPVAAAAGHDDHDDHDDGHSHAPAGAVHDAAADDSVGGRYLARGAVTLPATGAWHAELVIRDPYGGAVKGESVLDVVEDGPNQIYLASTGLLIGGSVLYGAFQRRRRPAALLGSEAGHAAKNRGASASAAVRS